MAGGWRGHYPARFFGSYDHTNDGVQMPKRLILVPELARRAEEAGVAQAGQHAEMLG